MNSNTQIVFLIAMVCVFTGCRTEPVEKPIPDSEYPSTYRKILTQQNWEIKNAAFQQINVHENLFLNQQGFLEGQVSYETDSLTLETVVQKVQELISRYSVYMGIPSGQTFDLENMNFFTSTLIPNPEKLSGNTANG
ncbi:MAG: hypothetical protein K0B11_04225 [Mariniphaga sp.]|nr:hypothetical protein [Mariniphaga sp.]